LVELNPEHVGESLPFVVNNHGVSTKGIDAFIREGKLFWGVSGKDNTYTTPQEKKGPFDLPLRERLL
jgi:hypothetical protein